MRLFSHAGTNARRPFEHSRAPSASVGWRRTRNSVFILREAVIDSEQLCRAGRVELRSPTAVVRRRVLRAIVSKRVLDRLIREKLRQVRHCAEVSALPVVWRRRLGAECNWEIPGWVGEARALSNCAHQMDPFVRSLESQFDIADEEPSLAG